MTAKVPVFYHIPKCGGSYVNGLVGRILNHSKPGLRVLHNSNIGIVAFVVDTTIEDRFTPLWGDEEEFFKFVTSADTLLAICTLPVNTDARPLFDFIQKLLDACDKEGTYYTAVRPPYERMQSLYNHLSDTVFSSFNFEEFIQSDHCSGSWIARNLLGLGGDEELSSSHVDAAIDFLKDFEVATVENLDPLVASVFFGVVPNVKDAIKKHKTLVHRNPSFGSKVTLASLGSDVENNFNQKNKFDIEIYENLEPRCIKSKRSCASCLDPLLGIFNKDKDKDKDKAASKKQGQILSCCNPPGLSVVYRSVLGEERIELILDEECGYYADGPVVQCDEDRPNYLHKTYWSRIYFAHDTQVWYGEVSAPCLELSWVGYKKGDICDPKGKYLDKDGALSFTII